MRHNALLCTLLVALVLGSAAAAVAGPAPVQAQPCSPVFEVPAQESEPSVSKMELPGTGPVEPEFLAPGFRKYCRCSCSFTPNCNTSADCGGSPCLAGVTCC